MHTELALAGVLAAVIVLLIAAQFLRVPYPILLVLGGLGLGFVPGAPKVELQTDSGAPFPERDLIIFLAFSVILVTLLLQGSRCRR